MAQGLEFQHVQIVQIVQPQDDDIHNATGFLGMLLKCPGNASPSSPKRYFMSRGCKRASKMHGTWLTWEVTKGNYIRDRS